MKVKNIKYEDFTQYKKCSMFIGTSYCDFKCDKLNGCQVCQNASLATAPAITIDNSKIIKSYLDNPLTSSIVFGGLEPFLQFEELIDFIKEFRKFSKDDVVIYTGYYKTEISNKILELQKYPNIIIKFGRFILKGESHFDEVLGVNLANKEQYAEKIS